MFRWLAVLIFFAVAPLGVRAQAGAADSAVVRPYADSLHRPPVYRGYNKKRAEAWRAARLAKQERAYRLADSMLFNSWLKQPGRYYRPLYLDSIERAVMQKGFNLARFKARYAKAGKEEIQPAKTMPKAEQWIPAAAFILLAGFGALRLGLGRQLDLVVMAFFNNRQLANLMKDGQLFTSRWFLLFFVHTGLTIGLVMYLLAQYSDLTFEQDGLRTFLYVSGMVIGLYIFKIILLRGIGYLFGVARPVGEYVTILYLCYYGVGMAFLPLMIVLAVAPLWYNAAMYKLALGIVTLIFGAQLLRAGVTILSNYKFYKFYLLLYFCALEIGPIMILIKAIGF